MFKIFLKFDFYNLKDESSKENHPDLTGRASIPQQPIQPSATRQLTHKSHPSSPLQRTLGIISSIASQTLSYQKYNHHSPSS